VSLNLAHPVVGNPGCELVAN